MLSSASRSSSARTGCQPTQANADKSWLLTEDDVAKVVVTTGRGRVDVEVESWTEVGLLGVEGALIPVELRVGLTEDEVGMVVLEGGRELLRYELRAPLTVVPVPGSFTDGVGDKGDLLFSGAGGAIVEPTGWVDGVLLEDVVANIVIDCIQYKNTPMPGSINVAFPVLVLSSFRPGPVVSIAPVE